MDATIIYYRRLSKKSEPCGYSGEAADKNVRAPPDTYEKSVFIGVHPW
jgi:hypothetical protein